MLAWIILLCLVGLVLVFAEMLIPGFGIFGILGGIFLLGMGLLVANIYGMVAFLITVVILIGVFILLLVMVKKSGVYQKVILNDKQEAKDFDESILQDLLQKQHCNHMVLRNLENRRLMCVRKEILLIKTKQ